MKAIRDTADRTSVELAREKGSFARFDAVKFGAGHFVLDLPRAIQDAIAAHGIRNSHLLSVAPTGSISLLANNVSSGIEPVFAVDARRRVWQQGGESQDYSAQDFAAGLFRGKFGVNSDLPDHFVTAAEVTAADQLAMQATVQDFVDNAVSKTLSVPSSTSVEELGLLLTQAHRRGLKGCAIYRFGSSRAGILKPITARRELGGNMADAKPACQ